MNNVEIRKLIFEKEIKKYMIAKKVGLSASNFSHLLEDELTEEWKERVLKAIEELSK